jgi:hypothetical protein
LKAGETVLVAAVREGDKPDQGLPPPEKPVDPGYGIDLGLGFLRPTHPIVLPPLVPDNTLPEIPAPVDPAYGIDVDEGYVRPEHPIVLPPKPKPDLGWKKVVAWTPTTGWVVVIVPKEGTLVPTPSKR